jgi:hypothetical protein
MTPVRMPRGVAADRCMRTDAHCVSMIETGGAEGLRTKASPSSIGTSMPIRLTPKPTSGSVLPVDGN